MSFGVSTKGIFHVEDKNRGPVNYLLFSGSSNRAFAEGVAQELGVSLSPSLSHRFREGNLMVRLDEPVRGKDVFIIQTIGLDPNNELMELVFLIDAARRASAKSICAIVPYFSYAKGDKLDEPQTSIRAKVCADLLESVGVDSLIMMDLHAEQLQGFFHVPLENLNGRSVLAEKISGILDDPVVFSPDAGFVKDARKFAARLDASIAIGDKVRKDHTESPDLLDIIGDVAGRDIIIVDDFAISGNTLYQAAAQLKRYGAKRIVAAVSHCLFDEAAVSALEASQVEKLFVLDTVANQTLRSERIEVVTATKLFAEEIKLRLGRDA